MIPIEAYPALTPMLQPVQSAAEQWKRLGRSDTRWLFGSS